jgi:hypothetical protein
MTRGRTEDTVSQKPTHPLAPQEDHQLGPVNPAIRQLPVEVALLEGLVAQRVKRNFQRESKIILSNFTMTIEVHLELALQ